MILMEKTNLTRGGNRNAYASKTISEIGNFYIRDIVHILPIID
jgi:hypothetical protein